MRPTKGEAVALARDYGQPIVSIPFSGVAESGVVDVDFMTRKITWRWNTLEWIIPKADEVPSLDYQHVHTERF